MRAVRAPNVRNPDAIGQAFHLSFRFSKVISGRPAKWQTPLCRVNCGRGRPTLQLASVEYTLKDVRQDDSEQSQKCQPYAGAAFAVGIQSLPRFLKIMALPTKHASLLRCPIPICPDRLLMLVFIHQAIQETIWRANVIRKRV